MQKSDIKNAAFDIFGESFWGLQAGMISSATVLVVVLRHFGAGSAMIGSITSIETVAYLFPQIVGLGIFQAGRNRKAQIILYHYAAIIPLIFLMAWILLKSADHSSEFVRWGLLVCWGLDCTVIGVIGAIWMNWIADLFDVKFRGTVMGLSFCASSAFGAGGGLVSSLIVSRGATATNFGHLYLWAAIIEVASISIFWLIDDSWRHEANTEPASLSLILGNFSHSLSDADFRSFLFGRILATSGFCILPLVGNYFSSPEGGSISPSFLIRCGTLIAVGTAVAQLGLGPVGDKFGHRIGLIVGNAAQITALILLLVLPGQAACLLVYLAAGICGGSAFLSHYNMVFETCPHENRSAHITLANLVIGSCTALTPTLAGIAAVAFGTKTVFLASLVLSIAALGWFLLQVKEPRTIAAVE